MSDFAPALTLSTRLTLAALAFYAQPALAQQTPWQYSQEVRSGQTPGLFAEAWSDNYIERTRALIFFKCDLEPRNGGIIYFAFVPSLRLADAPEEGQSGRATLFWRIDAANGGPIQTELSILESARLQYTASGEALQPILNQLRAGGAQLILADPSVPNGGVVDTFSLVGARNAVTRVEEGCNLFEPEQQVFPSFDFELELDDEEGTRQEDTDTDAADTEQSDNP